MIAARCFLFLSAIALLGMGCTKKSKYQPDPCHGSDLHVDVVVNGNEITATATGGEVPYKFEWSSGETSESADHSTIAATDPGTYVVDVTDKTGCTITGQGIK